MRASKAGEVVDFGEVTVTAKGQITLPSAMRRALNLAQGDKVRFKRVDGEFVMAARKRRSILDIANENAFSIGEKGLDLDKLIDDAVSEAMAEKMKRSRAETDD